jgi:hypothetical protein
MQLLLENLSPEDMKKYLKEYYNYAASELQISRPPKLFLKEDTENANNLLGKTGYYDPDKEEIYLYTTNRHAKDIIRSFAHELIHHHQKLSGFNDDLDLSKTVNDPAYASHDPKLREMERDAFERGNMMFRDWCDAKKMERKQTMNEVKINIKKSDLNKDGQLSGYEKKRGSAIANAMSVKKVDEVDIPKSKETEFKAEREKIVKGLKGEVPKKSVYPIAANKAKQKMGLEEDDTYGDAEAKGAPAMNEEDQVVEAIYNKVMEKLKLQEAPREDDEPVEFGDDEGELDFSDPSQYQMNKGKVKKAGMSDFGDDEAPEVSDNDMEEIPTGDDEAPASSGNDPMAQLRAEKMMTAIKDFLNNARKSLADGDNEEAIHNFLEGRKATARLVKFIKANPHLKLKHKGKDVDLSKLKERKWKKKKPMKESVGLPHKELFIKKERLMNERFNAHEDLVYQELMNKFIKKE